MIKSKSRANGARVCMCVSGGGRGGGGGGLMICTAYCKRWSGLDWIGFVKHGLDL